MTVLLKASNNNSLGNFVVINVHVPLIVMLFCNNSCIYPPLINEPYIKGWSWENFMSFCMLNIVGVDNQIKTYNILSKCS